MGLKREGRSPLFQGPWEELLGINQGKKTEEIALKWGFIKLCMYKPFHNEKGAKEWRQLEMSVWRWWQSPHIQAITAGDFEVSPRCTVLCIYIENILSPCYVQGPELNTQGVLTRIVGWKEQKWILAGLYQKEICGENGETLPSPHRSIAKLLPTVIVVAYY